MKLSGHKYDNDVFNSLLNGLLKDVELKKDAQTNPEASGDSFAFSSVTAANMADIRSDQLEFVASELSFAADKAKIVIGPEDLAKFASQIQKQNLRGKAVERAAQQYCNQIDREVAYTGSTKLSGQDLIDKLASHKVTPAGYNPAHGANNSHTGKYMWSSKNPNTIWDTDALEKQAQVALGDEKIKASKKAQKEHRLAMKTAQWEELQEKHSKEQLHKGISNTGTSETIPVTNQKSPANTMSIFSDNRDFENIPQQTIGEDIIAQAEARANKKQAAKDGMDASSQKPMNTRNALDKLFNA